MFLVKKFHQKLLNENSDHWIIEFFCENSERIRVDKIVLEKLRVPPAAARRRTSNLAPLT